MTPAVSVDEIENDIFLQFIPLKATLRSKRMEMTILWCSACRRQIRIYVCDARLIGSVGSAFSTALVNVTRR